ncbi:copper amine oxidase [Paenibacillus timonensis]|nr:phosphodiester glycosidase family protein [Paenibacillus timonensis]MUG88969.1 copper amine oxidase [Paenibacillus timonensis]
MNRTRSTRTKTETETETGTGTSLRSLAKRLLALGLALVCLIPASSSLAPAPASAAATAAPAKNVVLLDAASGHAFVPSRALNGLDGIQIQWDASRQQLTLAQGEATTAILRVGSAKAEVNGEPITLTDAPFTEAGATYVPLQFVSATFQLPAEWDKTAGAVSLGQGDARLTLPYANRGTASTAGAGKAIVSERKTFKVGGRSFSVQMVTISLMDPKVRLKVALAGDTVGKVEELSGLAKRHKAVVAVNGTFFNAYTNEAYKAPYGYIVSGGELKMKASGDKRTIFTYDSNLLARLIPGADFNDAFGAGTMEGALQAGPRLVVNGKVAIDVKAEGFKDPKILTGGGARSALGLTRDHKLILLTSGGATIPQLAEIMKQAGAYQAMNLDGGASSGLYYNGKYLTPPGRKISNALIVTYQ